MKTKVKENKSKAKIAFDVVTFTVVFLLFICSLLCLITRLNGSSFTIFGNRFDVVLTNSMAEKNPAHEDFLKDDNNQFKAFDLAISKPLPKPEEIKVHDVVIYTDKSIGTNMHRIVEIDTSYFERIYFTNASISKLDNHDGISLDMIGSQILTNDITFKTFSLTTYSLLEDVDNFNFYAVDSLYGATVTRTPAEDGGYFTTYNVTRETSKRGTIIISHRAIYDYTKEIITGLHIDSENGAIDLDVNNLVPSNEENVSYMQTFNKQYIYKTRGDAAKDDDGWSTYNDLQALVVGNAPGMGYPIRFMGSIWGGLMFALVAILILVTDLIRNKQSKKEKTSINSDNTNDIIKLKDSNKTSNPDEKDSTKGVKK